MGNGLLKATNQRSSLKFGFKPPPRHTLSLSVCIYGGQQKWINIIINAAVSQLQPFGSTEPSVNFPQD